MKSKISLIKQVGITLGLTGVLAWGGNLYASSDSFNLNIPSQRLATALLALGEAAGIEIVIPQISAVDSQRAGLQGEYNLNQALESLLAGSGLSYEFTSDTTVVVTEQADAQPEKNKSTESKTAYIEEVIVTATKRETSLQDTAMSITAVGSEEIARRGLSEMGDYLNTVPSVSFIGQTAVQKHIVIRGMSSSPQLEGAFGPLVGVYFGEVPIQGLLGSVNGESPDIKLVDIERVEVLRGPQGTLYGSSNLSGTVRNIPNSPNLQDFEGRLQAGYSHTTDFGSANNELQGVVNFPIIEDRLAIRAVGYRYDDSGFYNNIGANDPDISTLIATYGATATERHDIGAAETTGGRISLLWKPTEYLSVNLSYLEQETIQDGWPTADLALGENTYQQSRLDRKNAPGFLDGAPFDNEGFSEDIDIANATVEYDLGWASILSSTSWISYGNIIYQEYGELAFGGVPVGGAFTPDAEALVEELRLTSQFDGPLQFVTGFFYQDVDASGRFQYSYSGDNAANNPFVQQTLLFGFNNNTTKQKAVFGEVSYKLLDELKLTAGGRWFDYDRTFTDIFVNGIFAPPGGSVTELTAAQSDVNFKAGVDYVPSDDTLLYASWSQGFRLGRAIGALLPAFCDVDGDGFVDGSDGVTLDARQLDSDTVDSYEVGGKFSMLQGRLQVNSAIFQNNWDKIPARVPYDSCSVQENAGTARSRGVELEGAFNLSDSLFLNFSTSYVESELTQDSGLLGNDGDRLPGSPKFNASLGLRYEFSLAGYEAFVRNEYYYVGGFYNNLQETGREIGDYGMWNAQAGVSLGVVDINIYANNITNENSLISLQLFDPRAGRLRPRTLGMRVSYNF